MRDYLNAVGIMTGNSLDGVDVVLTKISQTGEMLDLQAAHRPFSKELSADLRSLRSAIIAAKGTITEAEVAGKANAVHAQYLDCIEQAVRSVVKNASEGVDLIGFHGQTLAHQPPSAKAGRAYTVQLGSGQELADRLGIAVVSDFRSDDIAAGGEGAPLAPMHHARLAQSLKSKNYFPIAFCNAGNTGNITLVSESSGNATSRGTLGSFLGWDAGPFNHFTDLLMQREAGLECDKDGALGRTGKVQLAVLRALFERGAVTNIKENFFLKPIPRSSDPQWYVVPKELESGAMLADRVRTAEYAAAYVLFHSLHLVPETLSMPSCFALSGGGWKNPVCFEDFRNLVIGNISANPVLDEHKDLFQQITKRIRATGPITVELSDHYGIDATSMEARIFADAAVCRIQGLPFTRPEVTGVSNPTVCGVISYPKRNATLASKTLQEWLAHWNSAGLTIDQRRESSAIWSRAVIC